MRKHFNYCILPMLDYLEPTEVVDWMHPEVRALAARLAEGLTETSALAQRSFEWVRDEVRHSRDAGTTVLTCSASDVLRERSGYCYAKSHLLAALLRANGIPAGFCYQRLSRDDNGAPFSLHGLNAVMLPELGWYRIDPRGNKPGVDAQFTPPVERLAFRISLPGEADLPGIHARPLPVVVHALRTHDSVASLWESLPDAPQ